VKKPGREAVKSVALTLLLAWVLALVIGLTWGAATHFENGPEPFQSIATPILSLGGAILLRRYWPSSHARKSNGDNVPGDGWYPDPAVAPPRWRRWDGSAWTDETSTPRGYLYGMCMPVTGKLSRAWNVVMAFFVMFVIVLGTNFVFRHLFPVGDPDTVYVDPLHHVVDPKAYIKAQCPDSVRSVDHLVGDGGRHAIFLQVWSVEPLPGHVNRAFFDPSTGAVTCP
jgi:hypothetical protein